MGNLEVNDFASKKQHLVECEYQIIFRAQQQKLQKVNQTLRRIQSSLLTHWGQVTHICVSKLTIIGSDNGLAPDQRQAIIWTNAGILFIGPLGTNFSEILIEIRTFSFKKMHLKMSSGKWHPFCLGLNVLTYLPLVPHICVSELSQHWFR